MAISRKQVTDGMSEFYNENRLQHVSSESMTVPDESLTIPEILERWSKGLPVSLHVYAGEYDHDFDASDPYDKNDWYVDPMNEPAFDLTDIDKAKLEIRGKRDDD